MKICYLIFLLVFLPVLSSAGGLTVINKAPAQSTDKSNVWVIFGDGSGGSSWGHDVFAAIPGNTTRVGNPDKGAAVARGFTVYGGSGGNCVVCSTSGIAGNLYGGTLIILNDFSDCTYNGQYVGGQGRRPCT